MDGFKVSVVVPAYNEQESLRALVDKLVPILSKYNNYEVIFVDDGSTDRTIEILETLNKKNERLCYLSFSRNFGHQIALKAGLDHSNGDCVITMDADLQHPPELIDDMIEKWQQGYEVVYTLRDDVQNVGWLKKITSNLFYKLMSKMAETKIDRGAADFRLMDKVVVNVFRDIKESPLFVRGMVSWVGFKQFSIKYIPDKRYGGKTKYSVKKMTSFALNGITSFSIKPLRLATLLGMSISGLAFLYGFYAVVMFVFTNKVISGWTSVACSVLLIGGLQLLMLGIFGEYLGKLFMESKNRPTYIIKKKKL
ncbi:MAG: glycosyltransferase family 2 protein [Anaerohalosphaeraceae bacterium]|nr:glycosyltransferase family 2 protein [Anaerohalosphaeraceae bacterium]